MFITEIFQCEFLFRNLVHGRTGISHRPHLVGIKLLPPVQRAGQVHIDRYHPHELPVIGAGVTEALH